MVGGRRVGLAGFVASAVLVFGACGGSPAREGGEPGRVDKRESAPEPTPTRTPTPEPAPTPTSDLATELEATANEFYSKLDHAYATHESEPFREMSGSGCSACRNYFGNIEMYVEKDQYIEDGVATISKFEVVDEDEDRPVAKFTLRFGAGRIVDVEGTTVRELRPESHETEMEFERFRNRWIVAEQR